VSREIQDKELVKRLRADDMSAFDTVYRLYSKRVFRFAISLLKNREDAEEIVQEVFFRVWEKRERLREHLSFRSYLFTITYNTSISLIRKRVRENAWLNSVKELQQPVDGRTPGMEMEYAELEEKVKRTIEELPVRQREIFLLSREEGLSYKEIAERLGISVNTVENHMVKALRFLRDHLCDLSLMLMLYCYLFL